MIQVVIDIVAFVNDGVVNDELRASFELLGRLEMRIVSINLLSWLKSRHRMRTKRPLDIYQSYPWQNNLRRRIEEDARLAMLFTAGESSFDFRTDITEDARSTIRSFVDESYHPPLRT